ncbi:quinon protein alcohol dehydrogenase-like superfamily [Absidia repens]|uniref:Quinon protein alcohol dehydrogenase-like superfamily n=1 Tax=Absidia repens TaxID=90262 RepID=A0A1X2J0N2_9FUNG|nr:quinon protein alcohol dehydrogenase-like superfamily [Absidia repens]
MSLDSFTENDNTTDIEQTKTNDATTNTFKDHSSTNNQYGLSSSTTTSTTAYIHQLSVEVVAHIFARLDPISLTTVAKTCRYWRHIVKDDVCWKNAFLAYFGQLPYKRLRNTSWKSEYILRTHLIRKWEKGRGTLMTFNPKIGSVDTIFVDFENHFMMAASKEQGVAVKCNPATGKLERHLLYSTDEGMPTQVSALKMDSNRVLWGFSPGYITMTTRAKTLVRRQLKVFSDFHQGAVRVLCLPSFVPDVVLSGGDDGMVKIWDASTGLSLTDLYGSTSSPTCLEATNDHHVIAGFTNGTVVLWNLHLGKLLRHRQHVALQQQQGIEQPDHESENSSRQRRLIHPPLIDKDTPVQSVHYDMVTRTLLVAYDGLSRLYQYNIETCQLVAIFGSEDLDRPLAGHTLGTICAVTWDIEPSFHFTDETVLDSRMTMNGNNSKNKNGQQQQQQQYQGNKRQQGSRTSLSSSSSPQRPSTPSTSTSPTIRLVATGDTSGAICLWPLNRSSSNTTKTDDVAVIHPLRQFLGHESPISAIHLDGFKMVSGADDGWIRIWDPLTGEMLHALGNKIPRHAPVDRTDVSLMRVKNIFCDEYRGVATIGHQVKSWDFSSQSLLGRKIIRTKSKAPTPALRDELHYEIKQEVKASQLTLAEERKEQALAAKEMDKWTLGGLSDEEMMAYAMMISQEQPPLTETQESATALSSSSSPSSQQQHEHQPSMDYDEDEALLQAVMASLNMSGETDLNTTTDTPSSSSPTTQITNIPASLMDSDLEWPSIESSGQSSPVATTQHNRTESSLEDEDDEELQYVLRISRGDI